MKYDYTRDGSYIFPLKFSKYGTSTLYYVNTQKGGLDANTLGLIYSTPQLKEFLICVMEPVEDKMWNNNKAKGKSGSWNGDNGLYIVAPAKTREEGVIIAEKFSAMDDSLSMVNWEGEHR